jgi:hypothetical protein
LENADIPFDVVVAKLQKTQQATPQSTLSASMRSTRASNKNVEIFHHMFDFQLPEQCVSALRLGPLQLRPLEFDREVAIYEMTWKIMPNADFSELTVGVEYSTQKYCLSGVQQMMRDYSQLLADMADAILGSTDTVSLKSLGQFFPLPHGAGPQATGASEAETQDSEGDISDDAELADFCASKVSRWNHHFDSTNYHVDVSKAKCWHEMIATHARVQPQATAVVFEDTVIT